MRALRLVLLGAVCLLIGGVTSARAATYDVTAYGATGNDTTNDSPAFWDAINAVPPEGGEVYIPAGEYYLSWIFTISGKNISFRGDGPQATRLRWIVAVDQGFNFVPGVNGKTLRVVGMSFYYEPGPQVGAAIGAYWPTIANHTSNDYWSVYIDQCLFRGWTINVDLQNATQVKISNFSMVGWSWTTNIRLKGSIVPVTITNGDIWGGTYGIKMEQGGDPPKGVEGIHISDVEMGAVGTGIKIDGGHGTAITNNHINSTNYGIDATNFNYTNISNNTFYITNAGTQYKGINLVNTIESRLIGNHIAGMPAAAHNNPNWYGIHITGSSGSNVISSNSAVTIGQGIVLSGAPNCENVVIGNLVRGVAAGGAAYVVPNTPSCPNQMTPGTNYP